MKVSFLELCVCFVDRCLSFNTFTFGHCVVCSSSIYGFWLPLWYLQTLIVLAMFVWAHLLANQKILFSVDNQILLAILNKRTLKPKAIMRLVRPLVLLLMQNTIHIEGKLNENADSISISDGLLQIPSSQCRYIPIRNTCGVQD